MTMKTAEDWFDEKIISPSVGVFVAGLSVDSLRAVQRDALEAAAKAVCHLCHQPGPNWHSVAKCGITWEHLPTQSHTGRCCRAVECKASAIHELKAALEPTP